jgi:chlorobactene glucosyltransferase
MIHELLLFLAASALTLMALVSILNALAFPRLDARAAESEPPFVSILVPARDEAPRVARTVGLLLAQAYPRFELLLLDDASTDDTADRALEAAQGAPRFRLLRGQPLPAGWIGKNWACQQLSEAARGDLLLFTDADVSRSPQALAAIAAQLSRSRADLLAVFPTQRTGSLAERLVVPLMALAVLGYLPVWAVHFISWPVFSAANGQCLAFRRAAYERIGGHAAVHSVIVEDMALAGAIKRAGLPKGPAG